MCWQRAPLFVSSVDRIDLPILSGIVFATLMIGEPPARGHTVQATACGAPMAGNNRTGKFLM
jgi:hypothetical protein